MRKVLVVLVSMILASTAVASDLLVKAEHHYVTRESDRAPMPVVFIDEHLIAKVKLDVYSVPEMLTTGKSLKELRALNENSWLGAVRWALTDSESREIALARPLILNSTIRRRGPNAALAKDRDATVECTTFEARLDFGPLPSGDYKLSATVYGLKSSFPVFVRTGQEPEVRDTFLELKAKRASSYAEYREYQLERHRLNPELLDPVFHLIDRALVESTLHETQTLFVVVLEKMRQRREAAKEPKMIEFFDMRLRDLAEAQRALPEYFEKRPVWMMVRDARGRYSIKDRKSGAIVRELGPGGTDRNR